MPIIKPKIEYGLMSCSTFAEINEEEHDVIVHYWTSAEEPDVNYAGGLDIETVVIKGGDIVNQIGSKIDSLESLKEDFETKAVSLKMHFDSMIEAGFTENQAMFFTNEFCKTIERLKDDNE